MPAIVILEGPDGSGKTWLAGQLMRLFSADYVKFDVPKPGDNLFHIYAQAIERASQSKRATIIDRLYLSELIYGRVMRGEARLDRSQKKCLEDFAKRKGCVEMVCLPAWETVRRNWRAKRADDYVKGEQDLFLVYSLYQEALLENANYLKYDYERGI